MSEKISTIDLESPDALQAQATSVLQEAIAPSPIVGEDFAYGESLVFAVTESKQQLNDIKSALTRLGITDVTEKEGLVIVSGPKNLDYLSGLGITKVLAVQTKTKKKQPLARIITDGYTADYSDEGEQDPELLAVDGGFDENKASFNAGGDCVVGMYGAVIEKKLTVKGNFHPEWIKVFGAKQKYFWKAVLGEKHQKPFRLEKDGSLTLMTDDEREQLYQKAKKEDPEAKNEIVRLHYGLIVKLVRDFNKKYPTTDTEELLAMALSEMARCISKCNPDEGENFAAYLKTSVNGSMLAIGSHNRAEFNYVPSGVRCRHDKTVAKKFKQALGDLPSDESAFSEFVKSLPASDVRDEIEKEGAVAFHRWRDVFININRPAQSLEDQNLVTESRGIEAVADRELLESLNRALLSLKPLEERVVRLRFGIGGDGIFYERQKGSKTFREIGEKLGFSGSYAKQVYDKALRKLSCLARSG